MNAGVPPLTLWSIRPSIWNASDTTPDTFNHYLSPFNHYIISQMLQIAYTSGISLFTFYNNKMAEVCFIRLL